MATRIAPVTITDAPDASRPMLESLKEALGSVPNLYATIARSPAALQGVLALQDALARGALSRREVEVLNLHVSELNGCGYCVSAHTMRPLFAAGGAPRNRRGALWLHQAWIAASQPSSVQDDSAAKAAAAGSSRSSNQAQTRTSGSSASAASSACASSRSIRAWNTS